MRSIYDICNPLALLFAVALVALVASAPQAASQPGSTQNVCVGEPTGRDVFSVGELRTSILPQTPFQEMNGAEWVLADGRPLLVQTALSPHLPQEQKNEYGLTIPDIRGRFLRMANNNVCANLRGDDEAYGRCIEDRDPRGDRFLGHYQPDRFARHDHGTHTHGYNDIYWSERDRPIDILGDGRSNNPGTRAPQDFDNNGEGWDRTTSPASVPPAGAAETRPKNIAVNFYIKICNCRTPNCR